MRIPTKIQCTPEMYQALLHAEKLLQECMELADHLAHANKQYNEEWFEAYKSLRCIQFMIRQCVDLDIHLEMLNQEDDRSPI